MTRTFYFRLEEARNNLSEAIELILEANRALSQEQIDDRQEVIKESITFFAA